MINFDPNFQLTMYGTSTSLYFAASMTCCPIDRMDCLGRIQYRGGVGVLLAHLAALFLVH